jgi:hypothetical protein
MARFSTYAEVITPDHITWKAYIAGIRKTPPGVALKEILERTGGIYENRLELTERFREQAHKLAQLTGDQELMKLAGLPAVTISLEHLRHLDPQTRIVCGYQLNYTAEESERLGLNHEGPFDPKNTIVVNLDPTNPLRIEQS